MGYRELSRMEIIEVIRRWLLAQSLDNPFGVPHMPTPGVTTTGGALRFWDTLIPHKEEPRVA